MRLSRPDSTLRLSASLLLLAALAACGEKSPAKTAAAPPPTEVAIVTVTPGSMAVTTELPGRVEASRIAEVRARAAGIVQKRVFREGSEVKAGDVLYRIDPAPFKAAYDSAQAVVAKADANLAQTTLKVQRYEPLVKTNAISKQEYDDAVTAKTQASADLAAGKAARQVASLNLGYATVTAPISGRIGRALVTEGALVGLGEATPLAMVQQVDPVYVNMTQSSIEVLRLQRAMASGQLQSAGKGLAKVTLMTEDGKTYSQTGKLLFSDLSVDASSGAITLRAEFPNPDRLLLPGMYVRAKIEQAINESTITVPQQAVQRTGKESTVMLVGAEDKVVVQPVKTSTSQGNLWIVTDGLKAGDKVIVEGFQKVKPGAVVKAVQWKEPAAADAAPAAPATPDAPAAGAKPAPAAAAAK
ncbi:efflux RND transporter periplasmic adaptor subunit [Actimicrobium sp. CCI2.3]|uniref:efflux RND transporter periplasmic adaptor subunit n=1 Tax=Actimicrobium sp. CCI2.3 TaxID=3048616 RepID=UPI002AB446A3|nr:efflux RND transporter periplasmic adaptor subunit [Actimicrobium sp. CCI2.3]MDY7573693.1 efflux RND transporter periplasmic adaptor subunit [Actimicrobium sp. CCI2.3]MEB0021035.1 efflux RND transporter periplasmic adaptor subunit [Actimicrobium sp. CCI2.3]